MGGKNLRIESDDGAGILDRGLAVSWRRIPESLGEAAGRVTLGNRNPVMAADHRQQSARATSITPAHLPANPHDGG